MTTQRVDDLESIDNHTAFIAAGGSDWLIAFGAAAALVLLATVAAFVGKWQGVEVPAFLPAVVSVAIVAFVLIASLLWVQHRAHPDAAPLAILSLGFGASATLMLPYLLTFPNIFSRDGLLDAGPQTAAWLHMSWHAVFCATTVWYALAVRARAANPRRPIRSRVGIATCVVSVLVIAIVGVATIGHAALPTIVVHGGHSSMYMRVVLPALLVAIMSSTGVLVAATRLRTRIDVWLIVVLLALLVETFVSGFEASGRYSGGWYIARAALALCSTGLLVMLHGQYGASLRRVVEAKRALRARNLQIEEFIVLQDDIAAALPSRVRVTDVVLTFAMRQTQASGCVLEMPKGDYMEYAAAVGTLAAHVGALVNRAESLSGLCSRNGKILLAQNYLLDPRVDHAACDRLNINSMIVVPIAISAGEVLVLKVASARPYAFNSFAVQALEMAAKTLAAAIRAAHEFATLEASEMRYRALTNAFPQLVAVVDAVGTVDYVNERWCAYTGLDVADARHRSIAQLVEAGNFRRSDKIVASLKAEAEFACEIQLRRHDGLLRWHSVRGTRLPASPDGYAEWIVIATDIERSKTARPSSLRRRSKTLVPNPSARARTARALD